MRTANSQLQEANTVEDEWMGKRDAGERKRLQNRLNQRAWRRRKAELASRNDKAHNGVAKSPDGLDEAFAAAAEALIASASPIQDSRPKAVERVEEVISPNVSSQVQLIGAREKITWHGPDSRTNSTPSNMHEMMTFNLHSILPPGERKRKYPPSMRQFRPVGTAADTHYHLLDFTLSADHYLITLIQYNVMRAIITNIAVCSLLHTLSEECESAFVFLTINPHLREPRPCPPAFLPTALQLSTPHHTWIDSVPCAQLRDNLIRYQESFDEDELCGDICGGLWDGLDDCETRGMLVWGDPWQVSSWEMTEGFARKWSLLLEGCHDMMDSTNRWRARRGEDPLVVGYQEN